MIVTVKNFRGGNYKKLFEKFIPNYCECVYVEEFKEYYESFQAALTLPQLWKACPYLAGKNEVHNFYASDNGFLPPYIPGGSEKWRLDVRFFKGDVVLGGYNLYVLVRNQESLLG